MPRGAAGGEDDAVHLEQLLVVDVEPPQPRRALFLEQAAAQRIAQAFGLLQDFLEHEMRVAAALDRREVPVDPRDGLLLLHRLEVEAAILDRPNDAALAVCELTP